MLNRVYKALRLSYQIAVKYRAVPFWNVSKFLPKVFPQALRMDAAFRRLPAVSRGTWLRGARLVLRGGRGFRPLSSVFINRKRTFFNTGDNNFVRPLYLLKKARTEDVFASIKRIFSTKVRYNQDLAIEEAPNGLEFYDIGMGCNAAVYALRLKQPSKLELEPSTSTESRNDDDYPLALKLMFNFDFQLSEQRLWQEMGAELVPLPKSAQMLHGKMGKYRPLPRYHPNIVRLLTAFTDDFRILPDAREKYPAALPEYSTYDLIIDQPRTLYVVMKRYTMTLADYVRFYRRNYWTGRVLFGQLLEGCVFLYDNNISQRDMKSDNILLQFNDGDNEAPHLVISDFGCALATGSWKVSYQTDSTDLGGNIRTRAPEIRTARPDPEMVLDFRMADTWAAGTIAYEIFTRKNPFYSELQSDSYLESEVPSLPNRLHYAVRDVVRGLLRRDPEERLLPHIASNVVCLSLFRFGADVQGFFEECGLTGLSGFQLKSSISKNLRAFGEKAERVLDGVLCLLAAESISARGLKPPIISSAELQLRATFLSRVDRSHMWEAVSYFFTGDRISFNTVAQTPEIPDGIILSPRIRSR